MRNNIKNFISTLFSAMVRDSCFAQTDCCDAINKFCDNEKISIDDIKWDGNVLSFKVGDDWFNYEILIKEVKA